VLRKIFEPGGSEVIKDWRKQHNLKFSPDINPVEAVR
jgi:hypothetical protein